MKSILSALVALSVLAGVAASSAQAATFGSLEYWVEHDRNMNQELGIVGTGASQRRRFLFSLGSSHQGVYSNASNQTRSTTSTMAGSRPKAEVMLAPDER